MIAMSLPKHVTKHAAYQISKHGKTNFAASINLTNPQIFKELPIFSGLLNSKDVLRTLVTADSWDERFHENWLWMNKSDYF